MQGIGSRNRTLLLGPILNANRAETIRRCREMLEAGNGDEFLYLAASKPLLDRVSIELLPRQGSGMLGTLGLHLLSGFSRRLLTEARYSETRQPIEGYQSIDRAEHPLQRPLMARILETLRSRDELGRLERIAAAEGTISSFVELIGEVQRAGKTAADFRDLIERRAELDRTSKPTLEAEPLTFDKNAARVYELYSGFLDHHQLTDASRDYIRSLEVLRGSHQGRNVVVPFLDRVKLLVIDGFFDLVPVHAEMLTQLVRLVPETVVNLNYDEDNPTVFEPFLDVIQRFEDSGCSRVVTSTGNEVAPGLAPLRERLFNSSAPISEGSDCDVELLVAPSRVDEVRAVAKRIKRAVLERPIDSSDIAIVARSIDNYADIVDRVFTEESIDVELDSQIPLADVPAVRVAFKALEAACANTSRDSNNVPVHKLTSLLKTDYAKLSRVPRVATADSRQLLLPFEPQEVEPDIHPDEIENAAAFVGIDLGLDDWQARAERLLDSTGRDKRKTDAQRLADLDAGDSKESAPDDATPRGSRLGTRRDYSPRLLEAAAKSLETLGSLLDSIPHEASAGDIASSFLNVLRELNVETEIRAIHHLDAPSLQQAAIDLRGMDALRSAVDAVVAASRLGAEQSEAAMSRAAFLVDLRRAVGSVTLSAVPRTASNGVKFLNATDVRGLSFDTIYVLGLVENEFPRRTRNDWIYSQNERETYRTLGLPLEDLSPIGMLRKEEHYFYQVACRARRSLVLCRPLGSDADAELVPSYFIGECERALGVQLVPREAHLGYDGRSAFEASTQAELARSVVRLENDYGPKPDFLESLSSFARQAEMDCKPAISEYADRLIATERARNHGQFDEFDGVLLSTEVGAELSGKYREHTFSASELNTYARCGFQFLANRVLGLRPRVEAALDLQMMDAGLIAHEILRTFYGRVINRLETLSIDEGVALLEAAAIEVLDQFEQRIPPLEPALWQIERAVLIQMLKRFVRQDLGNHELQPAHVELAFGMNRPDADESSREVPLVLEREGAEIRIRGQIDRVDVSATGEAVVYDYKLGAGPTRRDMMEGRDVQLGLYFEALERVFAVPQDKLAGGAYYSLGRGDDRRQNSAVRADVAGRVGISARKSLTTQELTDLRRVVIDGLWKKVHSIQRSQFPVLPALGERTCSYCDYAKICRFDRYRIRRKMAAGNE